MPLEKSPLLPPLSTPFSNLSFLNSAPRGKNNSVSSKVALQEILCNFKEIPSNAIQELAT
jgi:hypothetical protein